MIGVEPLAGLFVAGRGGDERNAYSHIIWTALEYNLEVDTAVEAERGFWRRRRRPTSRTESELYGIWNALSTF